MSNLLLESTRLRARWQRRTRLVVALSIAVVSVLIAIYLTLLPLTIYTYLVTDSVADIEVTGTGRGATGEQRRDTKALLQKHKRFIDGVRLVYAQSGALPEISKIIADIAKLNDVSLTRADVTYDEGTHIIYMAGVASSRTSVVSLQGVLLKYKGLELIDFPISNFAPKGGVYNFTAELKLLGKDNSKAKHE